MDAMRVITLALLVTSVTCACDICADWSGDLQPLEILHNQCKNGDNEIDGTFSTLAECQAAGGTTLNPLACGIAPQMTATATDEQCKQYAMYGTKCCGGTFTGTLKCDICSAWSGTLQTDKVFHMSCKKTDGSEIDGQFDTLAQCQAAGGTRLEEHKCDYMLNLGMSPSITAAQCTSYKPLYGSRCCGGTYTGTKNCDVCAPVTQSLCMLRTPSGCPNHPQEGSTVWKAWRDLTVTEATCASKAAEGNMLCGATDIETQWGVLPASSAKCLDPAKKFTSTCLKSTGEEVEDGGSTLEECKAQGGDRLQDVHCDYMYMMYNSPEIKTTQQCTETQATYGPMCCTATCPTTAGDSISGAREITGACSIAAALSYLLLQV
jgi:hypothetical protein